MRRIACVRLPEMPLQIVQRAKPEWTGHPVVVLDHERPSGTVLYLNEVARASGVAIGMRYAQAQSLAEGLRADVCPLTTMREAQDALLTILLRSSPLVEPHREEPGVYWLDAAGLGSLFASASLWARELHQRLTDQLWQAVVVVGFGRFTTYACAACATQAGLRVYRDPATEKRTAEQLPLQRLLRDALCLQRVTQLGLRTLQDLRRLPAEAVRQRIGEAAYGLRRMAEGDAEAPLQAHRAEPPLVGYLTMDSVHEDLSSIFFRLRALLPPMLHEVQRRNAAVEGLEIELQLDVYGQRATYTLAVAVPTCEERVLVDLLRLKLDSLQLTSAPRAVRLRLIEQRVRAGQAMLLAARPRRDLAAANQTLGRLRAELGESAVAVLTLREGHMPEARWQWCARRDLQAPVPLPSTEAPYLTRQLYMQPEICRAPRAAEREGPYVVRGGWWNQRTERHYYVHTTDAGALSWLYFDGIRQHWRRQAAIV